MRWPTSIFLAASLSLASVSASASQVTYLHYQSAPGDVVGAGGTRQFSQTDGKFAVTKTGSNGITFRFQSPDEVWIVELDARDGMALLAGPYPGASDFRIHSPTKPGIRVTANGRSCERAQGHFTILQLQVNDGDVERFAADLEQKCSGSTAILKAQLRFDAATSFPKAPDADLDGVPDTIDNCLPVRNQEQLDDDFDLRGDACDSTTTNSFLSLSSAHGDPIGRGESLTLKLRDGTLRARHDRQERLLVEFDGDDDWSFFFGAPEGERLEPGLYQGALAPDTTGPELLVSVAGRSCPGPSGLFEIHHVAFAPDGIVQSLAADFVQSCDGAPPLRGSVRYEAQEALLLRPKGDSTLGSSTVTFEWSDHVSSRKQFWLYLGTRFASPDLLDSGSLGTLTSLQVKDLPSDGRTIYVRLWARSVRGWKTTDYQFTASSGNHTFIPSITSPVPESTLPGSTVRFEWSANGLGVTSWQLQLGSTRGSGDLFHGVGLFSTYADVWGLPTDGGTLFARLWYSSSGKWAYEDFQFATDPSGGTPEIVSPAPGAVLAGADVQLEWSPRGSVVAHWKIHVGSAKGGWDLHNSGGLPGSTTSLSLSNLPTDGSAVYLRLWYAAGTWQYKDYAFTAASFGGIPALLAPIPGSVLAGPDVTFAWAANGSRVSQWFLQVGSRAGGYDLYQSGSLPGSATSHTVVGLPTDGTPIHVRLYYVTARWNLLDYSFTASSAGGTPEIVDPVPGSVLSGADVSFSWRANGSRVDQWVLYVGSTTGGYDLYKSAGIPGATTSHLASGLPTDGMKVYVRLYFVGATWRFVDYQYQASSAGGLPAVISPLPGALLPGAQVDFRWSGNGSRVQAWRLQVGVRRWGAEILDTGSLAPGTTARTVTGLPTDGSLVFATLWYQTALGYFPLEAVYVASPAGGTPHLVSPAPGSTLPGGSVLFEWTAAGSLVKAWWLNIGSSPGTNDVFNSGQLSTPSLLVSGLPTDGRALWVQLWYQKLDNTWTRVDERFTAASGS